MPSGDGIRRTLCLRLCCFYEIRAPLATYQGVSIDECNECPLKKKYFGKETGQINPYSVFSSFHDVSDWSFWQVNNCFSTSTWLLLMLYTWHVFGHLSLSLSLWSNCPIVMFPCHCPIINSLLLNLWIVLLLSWEDKSRSPWNLCRIVMWNLFIIWISVIKEKLCP